MFDVMNLEATKMFFMNKESRKLGIEFGSGTHDSITLFFLRSCFPD
jgi:hypothetical protein